MRTRGKRYFAKHKTKILKNYFGIDTGGVRVKGDPLEQNNFLIYHVQNKKLNIFLGII